MSTTREPQSTRPWTYCDSEPVPKKWQFNIRGKMTPREKIQFWYLRYLIATSTFMLEPWERRVFDLFVLGFVFMACYATYLYLPAYGLRIVGGFWEAIIETARRLAALSS